jgi:hypothetical protein
MHQRQAGMLLPRWCAEVVPGRRPRPIGPPLAEVTADGIGVEIVDRRENRRTTEDIAVETSPLLPEPETGLSGPLPDDQGVEQGRAVRHQGFPDVPGHGLLDPGQISPQFGLRGSGQNEQVDMLGHIHERHEVDLLRSPGFVEGLRQSPPPIVPSQERPPLVARERELVEVPRFVPISKSSRV